MSKKHNEDSRVKIPAILHLVSLGYEYLSLKDSSWDPESNIFPDIFKQSIAKIHPALSEDDTERLLTDIKLDLQNEDLGRAFYRRIVGETSPKLIDFEHPQNNSYHIVTELTCKNGDDEFRPDITLLINGLPLVFIEVKIPNNRDGILAERTRINQRFQNPKFRNFINITQLMLFSNNMEYDDSTSEPIEGAFYATTSYDKPHFNYFREERSAELQTPAPVTSDIENFILKDTNLQSIKNTPEYATNKNPDSPTHRLCTSLLSHQRLLFLLRYSLTYVTTTKGLEKHIMRYPQIFATKAISQKLDEGIRKGIIWHTQGSGKTALAYYNVAYLTDYYQKKGVISKFYFIVDRLDLLIQASLEFRSRGLIVHEVESRDAFARDIASKAAIHNNQGKLEITVVNIQKFKDNPEQAKAADYNLDLQRVYFLDEVHRSYNPKGSFLANLKESDPNAIKIGLTGTPLIGEQLKSKDLFGDYIHKYYYNASIKDGYTLRLIRENIQTGYHMSLAEEFQNIELLKGSAERKAAFADAKFAEPMLDYVVTDFTNARLTHGDNTIGAMIICDSSEQAKMLHQIFVEKYAPPVEPDKVIDLVPQDASQVAEEEIPYSFRKKTDRSIKSASLILHDIGTKDSRKAEIEDFKDGKIDILIVYNMLLTGFDAPRLKKLYLGRIIKDHNLLQSLTRVNRTYKKFQYGYVVDFADISKEFKKTNQAYFDELQKDLGDEAEHYADLFKTEEEIDTEIDTIKDILWKFDTNNLERFSQQVTAIEDRTEMLKLTKALNDARALYNLIRLSGKYDQLDKLDFTALPKLATMAGAHLSLINQKIALETASDNTNILNVALEDIIFTFTKLSEEELRIADELKNTLRKTREGLAGNFDPADPEFISLKEELERLFKKKNLTEISQEQMASNIAALNEIQKKSRDLERRNQLLRAKYQEDAKYARLHKRLLEKYPLTDHERKLFEALTALKLQTDEKVINSSAFLNNTKYAEEEMLRFVIEQLHNNNDLSLELENLTEISQLIFKEYLAESQGGTIA
ncbi:MAG: type I restriction enzyme R subunit [Rubritalea sp.]|jgi:type I restriction enzyme R subunit